MLDVAVPTITSRHHPFVQQARRVARGDARLAVLDGWHLLGEALDARLPIEAVAVTAGPPPADAAPVLARLRGAGVAPLLLAPAAMQAASPVRTPSGVVTLVHRHAMPLERLISAGPPLVLVAVDMQDPGNVGATIRAAEAGGATGVAVTGASADPWGWKALRAAMGSTFRLPVAHAADPATLCDTLRARGLRLVAAVPRAGVAMHEVDFRVPTALLLGGEGPGLGDDLLARADAGATIPMCPPVESLNVAVAAALLVYEARRQRCGQPSPLVS